ncbi:hypothetical protein [Staphylococcus aureus]|nr:hypothetical protein [Staphylococcus aureus]
MGLSTADLEEGKNGGGVIGFGLGDECKAEEFVDGLRLGVV